MLTHRPDFQPHGKVGKMSKANTIDYTGQVFSDLTAVERIGTIITGDKPKKTVAWKFRCVCGNEPVFPLVNVLKGHTLSCGCRRSRDNDKIKLCVDCGQQSFRLNRHGNPCELCHDCNNKRVAEHHKKDDPRVHLVNSARARAKRDGLPFDLTIEDITIPDFCPVLGIPIAGAVGKCNENSPTLDKIIPEKGYVVDNVAVISWRANTIKSLGTPSEHRSVAEWAEEMIANPPTVPENRQPALEFQSPDHRKQVISEAQKRRRARERSEKENADALATA